MSTDPPKVLVLGSDTRSFLSVIRSLGRKGIEVHVAWSARDSVATASKYVHKVHTPPRPTSTGWESEFESLLSDEKFDLVIPCNDPSILPLHQNRKRFAAFPIYLIDDAIFETVMDKGAVSVIAREVGLRIPLEVVVDSPEDLDGVDQLAAPWVLKPTRSYVSKKLSKKNHVRICHDRESARRHLHTMLKETPVAVQEFFQGHGVGVEFIAEKGRILSAFQHERLHEPPDGGGSSYRRSCALNPDLIEATSALVDRLSYTGIGMAEFRVNATTGDWIFVELNSRFWGSLPLAVNCGADFPAYLFDLLCHNRSEFPRHYALNRACRNWLLDTHWLQKTLSDNRFSISKQLRLAWQLFCELRFPLMLRESSDTFQWTDPVPAIRELTSSIGTIPRRVRCKISGKARRIPAVRNRARQRLEHQLNSAQNILFVCKGNICRSPFAERYSKLAIPHVQRVESSGYFPKRNRPSPDNAQAAASEFDIDLSLHRSSVLTQDATDHADVILVFDEENREQIRSNFSRVKAKTFLLGTLLDEADSEITDPYGGSVEDFRTIYSKIAAALDRVAK